MSSPTRNSAISIQNPGSETPQVGERGKECLRISSPWLKKRLGWQQSGERLHISDRLSSCPALCPTVMQAPAWSSCDTSPVIGQSTMSSPNYSKKNPMSENIHANLHFLPPMQIKETVVLHCIRGNREILCVSSFLRIFDWNKLIDFDSSRCLQIRKGAQTNPELEGTWSHLRPGHSLQHMAFFQWGNLSQKDLEVFFFFVKNKK